MPVDFLDFRDQVSPATPAIGTPSARSRTVQSSSCGPSKAGHYIWAQKLNWALNFTSRGCSTELGRSHVVVVVENASLDDLVSLVFGG